MSLKEQKTMFSMNPIDSFQNIIKNLYLQADEQKQSGEKVDMLNFLRQQGKDLRAQLEDFNSKYNIPIGLMKSKFLVENDQGKVEERYQYGTAVIHKQLSSKEVSLMTAAHNLTYFIKQAGETVIKYAQSTEFFLQNIGEDYKLKFAVINPKVLPNYLENQTIKDGSDICLAIGVVDVDDPSYSEELMQNLNIPEIAVVSLKEEQDIDAIVFGYPLELFDMKDGGHMVENDQILPFYCQGKMIARVQNQGDTSSLIYDEKIIFTTKGQSGGPIYTFQNEKLILIGHHNGNQDLKNFGSHHSMHMICDFVIPFLKHYFKVYSRPEDGDTYKASFDKFL